MNKFKSKVVEIEAVQWDGSLQAADAIEQWSNGATKRHDFDSAALTFVLFIKTLEGEMQANPGDWIIKGTEGEFYPCKPSMFERKYEPAG